MKKQQKRQYSGKVTTGSRKRMARAINNLVMITRQDVWIQNPLTGRHQRQAPCFITLTVPAGYNVKFKELETELMVPFLDWLVPEIGPENKYVRKVEYTVNDVPHYHLLVSCFVDHRKVRAKWNYLLRKAGLLDSYAKEKGHFKAPSTSVEGIRKKKNIAHYMIKELSKNKQNEKHVPGRVWACSDGLEEAYFEMSLSREIEDKLLELRDAGLLHMKVSEYCSIIEIKTKVANGPAPPDLGAILMTEKDRELFEYRKEVIRGNAERKVYEPVYPSTIMAAVEISAEPAAWKPVQMDFEF